MKDLKEDVRKLFPNFYKLEMKNHELIGDPSAGSFIGHVQKDAELLSGIFQVKVKFKFNDVMHEVYTPAKSRGYFVGELADLDDDEEMELKRHKAALIKIERQRERFKKIQELMR